MFGVDNSPSQTFSWLNRSRESNLSWKQVTHSPHSQLQWTTLCLPSVYKLFFVKHSDLIISAHFLWTQRSKNPDSRLASLWNMFPSERYLWLSGSVSACLDLSTTTKALRQLNSQGRWRGDSCCPGKKLRVMLGEMTNMLTDTLPSLVTTPTGWAELKALRSVSLWCVCGRMSRRTPRCSLII